MLKSRRIALFVLVLCSAVLGQLGSAGTPKPAIPKILPRDMVTISSETVGIFEGTTKCDHEGSVYFRKYDADQGMLSPTVKINQKGEHSATFVPSSFTDPSLKGALYFAPGPDGQFYQFGFAADRTAVYVTIFDKDGSPKSEVKLDEQFVPYQMAVFDSGELLLAGVKFDDPTVAGTERPFTAIFDSGGRLLKKISLKDDDTILAAAKQQDEGKGSGVNPTFLRPFNLGEAVASEDGNIYLLRVVSPAVVYAISPAGSVIRKITVDTPGGVMPSAMQVSGTRLAIDFWNNDAESGTVKLVDTRSGKESASYEYGASLGPMFACYKADQETFSFLTVSEKNKLTLVHAGVR